jgi:hypothetical protein
LRDAPVDPAAGIAGIGYRWVQMAWSLCPEFLCEVSGRKFPKSKQQS